jgi:hypothetical protein
VDIQTVPPSTAAGQAPWNIATRIAFRFCFIYFGLYVGSSQILSGLLPSPIGGIPPPGTLGWPRAGVAWVALHVFHVTEPLTIRSGSGDKIFDWVLTFCLFVISVVVTIVWSIGDRRRSHYDRLHRGFRLFLRFALGSTMVSYGMSKAIPLQMPAPQLTRLLEPFGYFSPMGVLWYSIGASRAYEVFTGFAELAGGILLFVPRLATLGAIICLADVFEIFVLNMSYDVPVKLLAFHLILLSLFLLAPDARRLANVLVLNRPAELSTTPAWRTRRTARLALIAQLGFGAYLVVMNVAGAVIGWSVLGGGAPKSPLYGIWLVEEMSVDGEVRSPLVTDYGRWRRVVFQTPTAVSFQRMDDTFENYRLIVDAGTQTITLNMVNDTVWTARFVFERPAPDRLTLDGTMDGRKVRLELRLFDQKNFLLLTRGFHWVQEFPINR